jgi:hypothetical protein
MEGEHCLLEVRHLIDDLRSSLEHITAEDRLLGIITDRLTSLRQLFPSHRSLFAPSDIEFLKNLAAVSDHLRAFIGLREELSDVGSLKEYTDIMGRLAYAKSALACSPVARRVAKEMRELNERLPVIREQDQANRRFRLRARILDLQQNPRRCPRNHPMVIRGGQRGHFWGCSRYPFCYETAQLSSEQNDLLTS